MSATQEEKTPKGRFRLHLEAETVLLLLGTVIALIWVNFGKHAAEAYKSFTHWPHHELELSFFGLLPTVAVPTDIHFVVTDLLMAIFFGLAAKEVFESFLPGGALSSLRKASLPLLATAGGMVGPAAMYLAGAALLGQTKLYQGWAIPCATDIAFSYAVARTIFGSGHPAIAFLLLLAIADDGAGLVIIAIAYPQSPFQIVWLFVAIGAVLLALAMKRSGVRHFAWYILIPGAICWLAFKGMGIHAALGLVPIIPCMPHARRDVGIFHDQEMQQHDALSQFEEFFEGGILAYFGKKNSPLANVSLLDIILLFFALTNAGVVIAEAGAGTFLVLVGLLAGKPLGIALFTYLGQRLLRLSLPEKMVFHDVWVVGCTAAIGFTVALFVADAAFRGDEFLTQLNQVKIGALASLVAAVFAIVISRPRKSQSSDTGKRKKKKKRRRRVAKR